ncbi:uncharacterized protein LOC106665569 [Cimex lectularius]|uniref:Uncharacterized protein n=1 Tax=Cimex lectularius TaxID=79782 RepID=A0A8I6SG90_CIMLE|nr:uncharacterized protein LOC106665569 [Cimex lectularius]
MHFLVFTVKPTPFHHYKLSPTSPPLLSPKANCQLQLAKLKKENTPPYVYKQKFLEILANLPQATLAFTDGSKSSNGVGAAFTSNDRKYLCSLSPMCSNFSAELVAIHKCIHLNCPTAKKWGDTIALPLWWSQLQHVFFLSSVHPLLLL